MTEPHANGELDSGKDTSPPEAEKQVFEDSKPPLYDGPPSYNQPPVQVVQYVQVAGPPPESYLGLSLFTLLFCCWVFGIIALLKSAQVNKMWYAGEPEQARRLAQSSKKWNIWGIVCGIVMTVLVVIFVVVINVAVRVAIYAQ